jgi:hypothetical protein
MYADIIGKLNRENKRLTFVALKTALIFSNNEFAFFQQE